MKTGRPVCRLLPRILPAIMAAAVCLSLPAVARAAVLYELDGASSYQEGCFDPCMCPIMMNDTLKGTFLLAPAGGEGDPDVYAVTGVAWGYRRGEAWVQVAGSGTYTLGPAGHRLELDLVAGDGPPRHYDSGLVPAPGNFPEIDIAAAVNGFFCYDYAFTVSASVAAVSPEYPTWGALKAAYR